MPAGSAEQSTPHEEIGTTAGRPEQEDHSSHAARRSPGEDPLSPSERSSSAPSPPVVTSKDMFEALVADMTTYQGPGYVDVWKATLQELFAAEYS